MKKLIALSTLILASNLAFGAGYKVRNNSSFSIHVIPDSALNGNYCSKNAAKEIRPGKSEYFTTAMPVLGGKLYRTMNWCYKPKNPPTGWHPKYADWYQTIFLEKPVEFTVTGPDGKYNCKGKKIGVKTNLYAAFRKFVPSEVTKKHPQIQNALNKMIKDLKDGKQRVVQKKGKYVIAR